MKLHRVNSADLLPGTPRLRRPQEVGGGPALPLCMTMSCGQYVDSTLTFETTLKQLRGKENVSVSVSEKVFCVCLWSEAETSEISLYELSLFSSQLQFMDLILNSDRTNQDQALNEFSDWDQRFGCLHVCFLNQWLSPAAYNYHTLNIDLYL